MDLKININYQKTAKLSKNQSNAIIFYCYVLNAFYNIWVSILNIFIVGTYLLLNNNNYFLSTECHFYNLYSNLYLYTYSKYAFNLYCVEISKNSLKGN